MEFKRNTFSCDIYIFGMNCWTIFIIKSFNQFELGQFKSVTFIKVMFLQNTNLFRVQIQFSLNHFRNGQSWRFMILTKVTTNVKGFFFDIFQSWNKCSTCWLMKIPTQNSNQKDDLEYVAKVKGSSSDSALTKLVAGFIFRNQIFYHPKLDFKNH